MSPARPLHFKGHEKGWAKTGKGKRSSLVSVRQLPMVMNIIILDKLDKTVKIDIFIKVISRDIHSVTLYNCLILVAVTVVRPGKDKKC